MTTKERLVTREESQVTKRERHVTTREGLVTTREGQVTTGEGLVTTREGAFLACLNRILPLPALTFSVPRRMTWLRPSNWLQVGARERFPALVGPFLHFHRPARQRGFSAAKNTEVFITADRSSGRFLDPSFVNLVSRTQIEIDELLRREKLSGESVGNAGIPAA